MVFIYHFLVCLSRPINAHRTQFHEHQSFFVQKKLFTSPDHFIRQPNQLKIQQITSNIFSRCYDKSVLDFIPAFKVFELHSFKYLGSK